jgi:alkylhydroperoxidase/carboxymuconolactone decarboxylase family protein YurZ
MSSQPRVTPAGPENASRLAHVPELEAAFWKLYGELWSHGALDQRTKEVARIRNARVTNCGL